MTHEPDATPLTPLTLLTRGRLGVGAATLATFLAGSVFGGTVLGDPGAPSGARADDGDAAGRVLAAGPGLLPVGDGAAVGAADSCAVLLGEYVERGRALVGPWGWHDPRVYAEGMALQDGVARAVSGSAAAAAEPRMREATASATGTTVQEAGVDEPDVVKTDGRLLVRVDDDELTTWDVTGADPERLASLGLDGLADAEVLLVGDRAVVLGRGADGGSGTTHRTEVVVLDLADPADPAVAGRTSLDARLVEARQHGEAVRLVTASGLPDLDFVQPGDGRSSSSALRENRRLVGETDLEDWLPQAVRPDGDAVSLLPCDAVGVPDAEAGLGTLAITTLLPLARAEGGDGPAEPVAATGLLSDSDLVYVSRDRIYVATPPQGGCCWPVMAEGPVEGPVSDEPRPVDPFSPGRPAPIPDGDGTTPLHAFALDGERTPYVASGEVDGLVQERWWMDERAGVLRVAVGATPRTGNFSSVITLEEDGDRLVELGRLDRIGVDEDIQSVRWFDEMVVLVTFRRIDPLHVVDLGDDADPRMRGELTMPGFSAYLHPVGPDRIIGVGEGPVPRAGRSPDRRRPAPWGAQAALFDLGDLDDPRKVSQHHWAPGSVAGAASDPRQLTWLPEERLALAVVARSGRLGRVGEVSILDFGRGGVAERSVEVEYGSDVADVRLVPLPATGEGGEGTRVLVSSGDGLERLPLGG